MEKKKSPTQLASWFSVNLYRDDLEEIIEKLTENCKQVIIEDNEYRYGSLDELFQKRGPKPKQLSINSREPYVIFNVRIKPRWTSLGTSGDGDNLAPYFYLKQLLESKKRNALGLLVSGPQSLLYVLVLVAWVVLLHFAKATPRWFGWVFISVMIIISVILGRLYEFGAFTKLNLKKKHELPSFWDRNKDELIRQILLSLITFGLGMLAAYLLFRVGLNKSPN
jgi:hypothetical protein